MGLQEISLVFTFDPVPFGHLTICKRGIPPPLQAVGEFKAGAHLAIYMTIIVIFFAGYGIILMLTQEQKQVPPLSHEQEERRTGNEKKQNGIF